MWLMGRCTCHNTPFNRGNWRSIVTQSNLPVYYLLTLSLINCNLPGRNVNLALYIFWFIWYLHVFINLKRCSLCSCMGIHSTFKLSRVDGQLPISLRCVGCYMRHVSSCMQLDGHQIWPFCMSWHATHAVNNSTGMVLNSFSNMSTNMVHWHLSANKVYMRVRLV